MKSEILKVSQPDMPPEFPKVMRWKFDSSRVLIVLFTEQREGVILVDGSMASRAGRIYEGGFYEYDDDRYWEPFTGEIKLVINNGK